ncbi:MAG: hypothetical protein WC209_00085 [Ignavibacteriaceae bacterium]
MAIAQALNLSKEELAKLAKNSFRASFFEDGLKEKMIAKVEEYLRNEIPS